MAEKRLSHAYMLVGPDDPERERTAAHMAAGLLCQADNAPCGVCRDCRKVLAGTHPDVITVERLPDAKGQLHRDILVDQIRAVAADAFVAPNEAARKVYVIREADRLGTAAQNALLKALEDPPGHACFLLLTTAADALLPTVRSRCVRADGARRGDLTAASNPAAEEYLRLAAKGSVPDITRFCMLRAKLGREEADGLLTELLDALCDVLCGRRSNPGLRPEELFRLTALLERGRTYLRHNVSPKQVFGVLAAETLKEQE